MDSTRLENQFVCFYCVFILVGMCAFSDGICLCFGGFAVLGLLNMGNTPSVPKESLLGVYLK